MSARQEWFSTQELAGLPGLPKTVSAVIRWAEKNLVPSRRKLRGKGSEYPREALPEATRTYLDAQDMQTVLAHLQITPPPAPAGVLVPLEKLPTVRSQGRALMLADPGAVDSTPAQRERDLARRLVLRALTDLQQAGALSTRAAAQQLLDHAQAGLLPPALTAKLQQAADERGRDGRATLPSVNTLRRWAHDAATGQGLTPRASAVPDLRVRGWYGPFFALTDRPQKPTLRMAYEQLLAAWRPEWADAPGAPAPSYHAVVRAYAKRSELDKLKGRHTGSALRARKFFHKRTYEGLAPFTEVHSDGWNTHFTAPHPVTGKFRTYEVWHFHCVATRYVTPLAIALTENTDVIVEGLRRCIRVGGIMAIWQTDHTSSVKNDRVKEEIVGLADRLGITVVHPQAVGNSQANGIAENWNKWLDRESRVLATYQHERMDSGTFVRVRRLTNRMVKAGDAADRDALRKEAMRMGKGIVFDSFDQAENWLQGLVGKWNAHPHRELPKVLDVATGRMVHMSPQQSLDAAIAAGWQPVKLSDAQLTDQFRPHYKKRVRRGTVTPYDGMRYHHEALAHHEGQDVLVAVDADDPLHVWVKDLEGRLLAVAKFVASVSGRRDSMREYTDRKRADAQIRLREQQIAAIEAGIAAPALEMDDGSRTFVWPAAPQEHQVPVAGNMVPPRRAAPADERPASYLDSWRKLSELQAASGTALPPAADAPAAPVRVTLPPRPAPEAPRTLADTYALIEAQTARRLALEARAAEEAAAAKAREEDEDGGDADLRVAAGG